MKLHLKTIRNKNQAVKAVEEVGVDNAIIGEMADKMLFYVVEIEEVSPPAATIMKQIAISRGTDAAVHRNVIVNRVDKSTVLIPGSMRELKLIAEEFSRQPFGLAEIGSKIHKILEKQNRGKK